MPEILIGIAGMPRALGGRKDYLRAVKLIRELGLDALEVEFVYGVDMSSQTAREVGDLARRLGVRLSVHAPYYINLCSSKRKVIEDSKRRIVESLERASEMGARVVVVHAAYYGDYGPSRCYEMVRSSMREIRDLVSTISSDVKIGVETTARRSQFGTLDEVIRLCKDVDIVVPCIDWAHVFVRNLGRIDYSEVLDRIERELSLKELHSHFTCVKRDERGEFVDEHDSIDKNAPPFEDLVRALMPRGVRITIICESPLLERDAVKMKRIVNSYSKAITSSRS